LTTSLAARVNQVKAGALEPLEKFRALILDATARPTPLAARRVMTEVVLARRITIGKAILNH